MKLGKYKAFVIVIAMVIAMISAFKFLVYPHHSKYLKMKAQARELDQQLIAINSECVTLNKLVYDLGHDPSAIEKVAREKFGLCKEGERFYRY